MWNCHLWSNHQPQFGFSSFRNKCGSAMPWAKSKMWKKTLKQYHLWTGKVCPYNYWQTSMVFYHWFFSKDPVIVKKSKQIQENQEYSGHTHWHPNINISKSQYKCTINEWSILHHLLSLVFTLFPVVQHWQASASPELKLVINNNNNSYAFKRYCSQQE